MNPIWLDHCVFSSCYVEFILILSWDIIAPHRLAGVVSEHITISPRDLGSIPGPVISDTVSPTARHRCDVSSELCCPGAKPRR